jgi:hypothetical protein
MWVLKIFVSEAEYPLQVGYSTNISCELALGFLVDLTSNCD